METVTAHELLSTDNDWEASTALLCFPGGADLPYCKSLGISGMQRIKRYVEYEGGVYLGICAGAYFASGAVIFEPSTELEVLGERHLKFYRGTARGAAFSGFDYESERGAVSARVRYRCRGGDDRWKTCLDYVNGGPYWAIDDADDTVFRINSVNHQRLEGVDILAAYEDLDHAVCAMRCVVGKGTAVLVGSHPELHHSFIDDVDGNSEDVEDAYVEHVRRLKRNLHRHEAARMEFFELLVEAGLESKANFTGHGA